MSFTCIYLRPPASTASTSRSSSTGSAWRMQSLKQRAAKTRHCTKAVSKGDLDEVEMQIAVVNHEMNTAAQEERFQEAAGFKSRLEALQLKQRCMQVEHQDKLRASICHHLGELIQHRKYKYRGVIFGVHSSCQASERWIQTMAVDKLPNGRHQPFYQVMVDERDRSGSMITYVAQENIGEHKPAIVDLDNPILHSQVDTMFMRFDAERRRYVPHDKLITLYPDSLEARGNDTVDAGESAEQNC